MLTELPDVKPDPLRVIAPLGGPEVGNTSNEVPKSNVNGLPNPVTKS